jgi:hypothetical protein
VFHKNSVINIDRLNELNEMNLLDPVVVLVDGISVADLVKMTVSGMAIDRRNNTAKPRPAKNEERQLRFIGDKRAPSLLLQMIAILY